jgi:cytoskeletal protein RodZ
MKGLNFLLHFMLLMKRTVAMTLTIVALGLGLVFASGVHTWPVLAQTNPAKNATQNAKNATGTNATKGATGSSASQNSSNKSSATDTTSTPASTTATVKGGPKAAGSSSQLQQIEGNNTNLLTNNTKVSSSSGLKGLAAEHNTTR